MTLTWVTLRPACFIKKSIRHCLLLLFSFGWRIPSTIYVINNSGWDSGLRFNGPQSVAWWFLYHYFYWSSSGQRNFCGWSITVLFYFHTELYIQWVDFLCYLHVSHAPADSHIDEVLPHTLSVCLPKRSAHETLRWCCPIQTM